MIVPDRPRLLFYGPEMCNVGSMPVTEHDWENLPLLARYMMNMIKICGGVGLAAPQVGVFKRAILIQIQKEPREFLSLINPEITRMTGREGPSYEGCLSIPPSGNGCDVPRMETVVVTGCTMRDPQTRYSYELQGLPAIIAQHEIDHLNGTFFVDRVNDGKRRDVLQKFQTWKGVWEASGRPFPYSATRTEVVNVT